ncbi:MAG: NusA-like transcription termination signal-binding factor [Thermoplasmata archaeon HGW-Thermoplasmata-1]|nr:MAG: NusA-like transcription termination signal-binding factor [Thermoplasmata archaeon HGW-Thermoplasmata-1]
MAELTLSVESMQRITKAEDVLNRLATKQLQIYLKSTNKLPDKPVKTSIHIKDCVEEEDRLVFVIDKGQLGLALGKKAVNLEDLKKLFGRDIKIVEYDSEPINFIANLFKPYEVEKVEIETRSNKKIAIVTVSAADKGKAIGKGGKNVQLAKKVAMRHHDIDDVIVA